MNTRAWDSYSSIEVHASSNENLVSLLDKKIDGKATLWEFAGVNERYLECISSICKAKGYSRILSETYYTFILEGKHPHVELRSEFNFGALEDSDVKIVEKHWPYTSETNEGYLRNIISHCPTSCIRRVDSNELVAWGLLYDTNAVGALHVEEGYRRLGLGSALLRNLTQKCENSVHRPYAYIDTRNSSSIKMFKKRGWIQGQNVCWIHAKRHTHPCMV